MTPVNWKTVPTPCVNARGGVSGGDGGGARGGDGYRDDRGGEAELMVVSFGSFSAFTQKHHQASLFFFNGAQA